MLHSHSFNSKLHKKCIDQLYDAGVYQLFPSLFRACLYSYVNACTSTVELRVHVPLTHVKRN